MTPRCIVEVRWGKLAGTKGVLAPGQTLRVGHSERADLPVPVDPRLSNTHFELTWDGEKCLVRDLESATGITLGGNPVRTAEVPHGGWIRAGKTDFMVYVEGRTPPGDDEDEDEGEEDEALRAERQRRREGAQRALAVLRAEAAKAPLYAVLDAARDARILVLLRESIEPHRSLYEGEEGEPFEDVAPYIVGPFAPDSRLLERLCVEGWGRRWGIHCTSREPVREVRRHFRRFLMVEVEETRERVYFRFYDPDVLRGFAEVWTPMQRGQLLAMVDAILVEDETGVATLS
jgi:pSer/pThr/pTyr-binding forkhead associated (FHA) protein